MKTGGSLLRTTTYDDLSRKRSVVSPFGKRLTYSYDANSRRSLLDVTDAGVFTYSYDDNGRLTAIRNPFGQRTTFSYDDDGRRTLKRLSNGTRATMVYDDAGRLTRLANIKSTGATISSFDYSYDPVGNKIEIVEAGGAVVTWSYDATYQLTAEHRTGSNAYRYTYTYDAAGNRLVKNLTGTRTTTTYDAANQIVYALDAGGRTTYSYDADGNQTRSLTPAGARTTTTYDYENRTTLIRLPSGVRNTMSYDPDGLRVQLDEAGGTKKFVYDNQAYLLETDGSHVLTAVYTQEPTTYGNLISQRRGSTTSWYSFDGNHSTRQLLDNSQNTTDTYLYDAFGNILAAAAGSTENPFQWHGTYGCYRDPDTGLYYLRARIINPVIAVFTTTDLLRFMDGMNLYKLYFVPGRVDPSGLGPLPGEDPEDYCRRNCRRLEFQVKYGYDLKSCVEACLKKVDPPPKFGYCGDLEVKCDKGTYRVPVTAGSDIFTDVFLGQGCYTTPGGIKCTGSCDEIKKWTTPGGTLGTDILDHEACHYCAYKDDGCIFYVGTWGFAPDWCVGKEVPSTPLW